MYNRRMNIGIIMAGGTGSRMQETRSGSKTEPNISGHEAGNSNTAKHEADPLPKQFIELGGKPVIMHSIETFIKCGYLDAIYIGMHPDWIKYTKELISEYKESPASTKIPEPVNGAAYDKITSETPGIPDIHVVPGGSDRNATLQSVLSYIESDLRDAETSDIALSNYVPINIDGQLDHIIVTHDAARPFVTSEMIKASIDAAALYGAATVGVPSTDTIAMVNSDSSENFFNFSTINYAASEINFGISEINTGIFAANSDISDEFPTISGDISSIPDRKSLFNVQTPQSFRLNSFLKAYSELSEAEISALTDASGVFLAAGEHVHIIPGDPKNIKITSPIDLKLAEALL